MTPSPLNFNSITFDQGATFRYAVYGCRTPLAS